MNGAKILNPGAPNYAPGFQPKSDLPSQVSTTPTPSPYLEVRLFNLEDGHMGLREDMDALTELYRSLCSSVDELKLGGRSATVGPSKEQESTQSHQSALRVKQELEKLTSEVHKAVDGIANVEKTNGATMPKANGSVPPHLRGVNGASKGAGHQKSIPPHLRGKNTNG
jgi:hypothetical protein